MDWLSENLPGTLGLIVGGALATAVLALAVTRLRGTWFAALAGANIALFLVWTILLGDLGLAPWRLQVVIQRLIELPLICGLAVVCVVQARRLPPSESRLAVVLRAAPTLLGCAWVLSFVGEQIWPRPSLAPFAEMPIKNWALLTFLCVPFQFYMWATFFLFARAAGPRSPTRRTRVQNLFLAVAVGGYGLSCVNVLVGYAVLAFLDNPARTEVTLVQFVIEERLFLVWGPALLLGLLIAVSPTAARAARTADALALFPLRERFEGLAWRLEATGALRRLARPLCYLRNAASNLGLSETDIAKASQTVKLAAIMGSPKAPDGLSRGRAADLLVRLEANAIEETMPVSASLPGRSSMATAVTADYLTEVLEAALNLSAQGATTVNLRRVSSPMWFELARVTCIEAGITHASSRNPSTSREAFDAYREAANLVRGA